MATYWVDHAGSDTAPYDTQAKAATTLATILAITPSAGDIIYCCDNGGAGETIAAELDLQSSGTNAGGYIKIIGCNASGTVDGTRYVIDANNNNINCFDFNGQDMWWLENIEVKNNGTGTYYGFYSSASGSTGIVMINCCANDCASHGYNMGNFNGILIRCLSYSNTGRGFTGPNTSLFFGCCARDNGDSGFAPQYGVSTFINCISHGNTDDGFEGTDRYSSFINCVMDGNTDDGFSMEAHTNLFAPLLLGCRLTNNGGDNLECNDEAVICGWCYFEDPGDENINTATDGLFEYIPLEATARTTSNQSDQDDTGDGYVDQANHDFATGYTGAGDPTLRRTAITIPWS